MSNSKFNYDEEFNFADVAKINRAALLTEAAERLDAMHGHLGGGEKAPETLEGLAMRTVTNDKAEFGNTPTVFKITDREYIYRRLMMPVDMVDLFQRYHFYLIDFPLYMRPAPGWAFNKLEVEVNFNENNNAQRERPKAFNIFPEPKFKQLFRVNGEIEVGVGTNFEFDAVHKGNVGLGASANAGAKAGLVIGPFNYSIKRAEVNHYGTGRDQVRVVFKKMALIDGDGQHVWVVAQVPSSVEQVRVRGELLAKRVFALADQSLIQAVKNLPVLFRTF